MTNMITSIFNSFVHQPSECQAKALFLIEEFLEKPQSCKAFVLRGSAGTGKTSLMQAVVEHLKKLELNFVLLAPTSKAVKILESRTHEMASTIHFQIYMPEELADGTVKFNYKTNDASIRTIYVVDEASMLPFTQEQQNDFKTPNALLVDLFRHIKEGNNNNQVIFVGDTYQLPPIHEKESVALSARLISEKMNISAQQTTLTEVKRQAENSPILTLANEIKRRKDALMPLSRLNLPKLTNATLGLHYFLHHFDRNHLQNIVCIANSNEKVQLFNQKVRVALGLDAQILSKGDAVMLDKNWMNKERSITKGTVGVVKEVSNKTVTRADLQFVDATIDFEGIIIETKVLLASLISPKGEVDKQTLKQLKANRMAKNDTYRSTEKASDDPYMNAIRLRYGYAITCHKAQGSEWKKVLIDPQYNYGNHQWLYTAVTRASEEVRSWFY